MTRDEKGAPVGTDGGKVSEPGKLRYGKRMKSCLTSWEEMCQKGHLPQIKESLAVHVKLTESNGGAQKVSEQGNDRIRDVLKEKNQSFPGAVMYLTADFRD